MLRDKPKTSPPKARASRGSKEPKNNGKKAKPAEQPPAQQPDYAPFDASFFRDQFPTLLPPRRGAMPNERPFVVAVVLGDGVVQLDVSHIEHLDQHWALFAVYELEDERGSSAPRRYVFAPYASIARVEVTGVEQRIRNIGFATQGKLRRAKKRKQKAAAKRRAKAAERLAAAAKRRAKASQRARARR